MLRPCNQSEIEVICTIINDAAAAYKGVIPADCWHEPYMSSEELRHEIEQDVFFWGCEEAGELVGVMGLQHVRGVALIRHAYVRTAQRNQGIGSRLLEKLREQTTSPLLVGTWAAAVWAIRFYKNHGFHLVLREEKDRLLRAYWSVPERQMATSVVLVDERWLASGRGFGGVSR